MTDYDEIHARFDALAEEAGLTVTAEFIPLSKSRTKDEKYPTLNWKVSLLRKGTLLLTSDYSAGCSHCPAYHNEKLKNSMGSWLHDRCVREECETGKCVLKPMPVGNGQYHFTHGKPILPETRDVISSLLMDGDVVQYGGFEDWASNYGYDTDSRKAEQTYRACLEIGLKIRAAIGNEMFEKMLEVAHEF
jgi:hypothetical protein